MNSRAEDVIVGIDLGTTSSLVAWASPTGPQVIPGTTGGVRSFPGNSKTRSNPDEAGNGNARDNTPTLLEISVPILRELKARAEQHLKRSVTGAVVAVPTYFDDAQRRATLDAGQAAGLDVIRIANGPTVAALACGLDRMEPGCSAIYDLGGGTLDVSIVRVEAGLLEVLASEGDPHVGGEDFNAALVELFSREISDQLRLDRHGPLDRHHLRTLAENAKIQLSEEPEAQVEVDVGENLVYRRTVKRPEFEALIQPFVDRTIAACARTLRRARLTSEEVKQVLLVGGSAQIPYVRQQVAQVFGRQPRVIPHPERVVALGAAAWASSLTGERSDMVVLDVTSWSVGVETPTGAMDNLITANARIPCLASRTFTTARDQQTTVVIDVMQGEGELARDCQLLGRYELRDIPAMPAGTARITVTFLIDQNGTLNLAAREQYSGRPAIIQTLSPLHPTCATPRP
ncbi:MAG: Hsp70 family protein [Planctomycetes bacterium]|nr:Hsp70 family protein [Planctomycetota bacterium]